MPPRTLERVRDSKPVALEIVKKYLRLEIKEPQDVFACHYRNVPADRYGWITDSRIQIKLSWMTDSILKPHLPSPQYGHNHAFRGCLEELGFRLHSQQCKAVKTRWPMGENYGIAR